MRRSLLVVMLALFAACGDNNRANVPPGDGGPTDPDAGPTGEEQPYGLPPAAIKECATLPAIATTCAVTPGADGNTTTILKGNVLTSATIFKGGQVAINGAGKIACVGCDCATGGEKVISCPGASISPGLINTHDHITYTQNDPYSDPAHAAERYDNRQQWRIGKDGHYRIPYDSGAKDDQVRWGELRFLMGGATSIVGSGGQPGLLRNLDQLLDNQGLGKKNVDFDTFPLDDANGKQLTTSCDYGTAATTEANLSRLDAYEPHTSEGIDHFARNEFLCESSTTYDNTAPTVSHNLLVGKTAMIHAIGLLPEDYQAMAKAGTGLIWSPRSNITLYGDTARVSVAARFGVEIALGTDWMPSGSMNLLRELACADSFNSTYLNHFFTDQQLWEMVTANAASVTATDDAIGSIAVGKQGDIAIFAANGKAPFRAVIAAEPKDVALVMRGGKVLFGDDAAVSATAASCDVVDVCGTAKRVCLTSEVGKTYNDLKTAAAISATVPIYPAFACGTPDKEPSCTPTRPVAVNNSSIYTGATGALDSDGDGIPDAMDNCPHVFNPIRPLDDGVQGDADHDGVGDACDPCPMDKDAAGCAVEKFYDRDGDGVANAIDNCGNLANADQLDGDHDGKGDACDQCPAVANPGFAGCPATIYEIKNGTALVGRTVRVANALVTARASNGFFVQVKEGDPGYTVADNSGLFVFTSSAPPAKAAIGSRVTVDGSITLFGSPVGELELDTVLNISVDAAGPEALPVPVDVPYADITAGGSRSLALDGVLVKVGLAEVSLLDPMFPPEFTVTDGVSSLVIDDLLFKLTPPALGQEVASVTGVLAIRQNLPKLEPRSAADFVLGRPNLGALSPQLSFSRIGSPANSPTFPAALTVSLAGPAKGNTTISLTSSDPVALTVADVVILDGQTSIVVPVTPLAAAANVTITATMRGQTATARVRVLGADETASTVTLSPKPVTVGTGRTVTVTVTLDVPASVITPVALSVEPVGGGTVPASVNVAVNATSATFTYTDTSGAAATIKATLGALSDTAPVTVVAVQRHLVISQVYGAGGNSGAPLKADFIELFNPGASPVSLSGWSLQYNSSAGMNAWNVHALPDVTIEPGKYFLAAESGGTNGVDLPTPDATGMLSLSASNGRVALVNDATPLAGAVCAGATVVDMIGYGSASCFEGAATAAFTATTGALRNAAGCTDNDNNLTDFTLVTMTATSPRNSATAPHACP